MNGPAHIHEKFRHVAGLPDNDRIRFLMEAHWIQYPAAASIIDTLESMLDAPKKPRMPNLLIVGESNQGKTTLVQRFYKLHGQGYVNEDVEPVKPVILTETSSANEKSLYLSILEKFAAPFRPASSTSVLLYQTLHLLKACNTRMLIVDEIHSLLTGTPKAQRQVMNAIKHLCNELAIPIVGVGTREAVYVLHTDPQHASRFDVVELPLWELNPEYQNLLTSFEAILPLRKPSNLHHPELANRIFSICGGNLGNLNRLLTECARQAIESGAERIDADIVKKNQWLRPTQGLRKRPA